MSEGLAVQGVEESVACSVSRGGTAVGLATLPELQRLSTERALVDFALFRTRERNTVVLELSRKCSGKEDGYGILVPYLDDRVRSLSAHVMDSILVTQPVGSLDLQMESARMESV